MAMNLYACTFKWLISKINQRIQGSQSYSSIGVLDIFGFENFDVSLCFNGIMCLSSVNDKLYQAAYITLSCFNFNLCKDNVAHKLLKPTWPELILVL